MAREPRVNAGVKSSAVLLFTNVGIFSCGSPAALLSLKLIFFSNWEEVAKKKKVSSNSSLEISSCHFPFKMP